jgi:Nucleotidyl transferase AbiEii toxin, Type IV TA system
MTKAPPPDDAVIRSIRARLENHARAKGDDIQRTLVRYSLERFLYRLSISPFRHEFVLKGAMLFSVWAGSPYRATGDLDLLGFGDNAPDAISRTIGEIAKITPEICDGLIFLTDNIASKPLRLATDYNGVALRFTALLGRARLPILIDVGFGDAVTPDPEDVVFPTLLDQAAPKLRAYPQATVIAEKLEALVSIGFATTRIKDFYDLWVLATTFDFDGALLSQAVKATFERRKTAIPTQLPSALSDTFGLDAGKQTLWRSFVNDRIEAGSAPVHMIEIMPLLRAFVLPLLGQSELSDLTRLGWRAGSGRWT